MTKEPPVKRIRKPEYKRNHPYVSERDARNLDDFFSPILCAGLRRFLTLKLEHIPADKFVMDPHSKLMELTNNFPAWPENLADETCAYENKVKKGIRLFAKYYRDLHTNKIPPVPGPQEKGRKAAKKTDAGESKERALHLRK